MKKEIIITVIVAVVLVIGLVLLAKNTAGELDQTQSVTEETMNNEETNNENITTTDSGLGIAILSEGEGVEAKSGDAVSVNYTGMLEDGTVFDSNVKEEFGHVEPFTFTLGQNLVIQGWEQGVLGMKIGEKRRLVIPAELGYGDRGAGALIPPGATLVFEVELLKIN